MKILLKTNIRIKLIFSLLSVVLITGLGSVILSLILINKNVLGQAYDDVRIQLNTAKYVYNQRINCIHLFLNHISSLNYFQEAVQSRNKRLLSKKLAEVKDELGIDILNLTDKDGKIIIRNNNPEITGDDVSDINVVGYAITKKSSCFGTDLISKKHLLKEGGILSGKAYIKVVPVPMARERESNFEDSGLLQAAASPVFYKNKFIGIIYGAGLINNNFEIVDRIKSLVFKDERLDGFDVGTATIFLDDLRVSTNVKNTDGSRAVGTQVSEEVYSKVFEHGKLWLDKAFVVNNWYISAYSPLYNVYNKAVGILYVGILEEKYNIVRRSATSYLVVMMLITALIAISISSYLIRLIIYPINSLVKSSKEIALGNYNSKLEICSEDEIGYLCRTFNTMIEAIAERDKQIKENAEMQIVKSEKLASLGRLASGMAHEINNPLTGVLSFSTILYKDLKDTKYMDDLKIVIDETLRCRDIVKNILDFARESRIEKNRANINTVISDVLAILEHHVNFQNIKLIKKYKDNLPEIDIDINQMKSVINNLALNAADAINEKDNSGNIIFSTDYDKEKNEVLISITDTGAGIKTENLDKIFDPFFTTKETGKGTGLGLAVTYGVIKRHNGWIHVQSDIGKGTVFKIGLPVI